MQKPLEPTPMGSEMSMEQLSLNLERMQDRHSIERQIEWREKEQSWLPPENFDPENEADVLAWERVIPNWRFGGHWFSKERYGLCLHMGGHSLLRREGHVPIEDVAAEAVNGADPWDWEANYPAYLYWRSRYGKQGYAAWSDQHNVGHHKPFFRL